MSSGGTNVETSLMLDVTGSMCQPCTKIDAVKSAAKDLIDIVVWADQSKYYSRVALAPFAEESPPLQPEAATIVPTDEKRRARYKPIMSAGTGL